MIRRIFAIAPLCLAAGPALATGDISCDAADGSGAHVSFGFGRVPGLAVIGATLSDGETVWRYGHPAEGTVPVELVGAAADGDRIILDFADEQVIGLVASVRLMSASEPGGDAIAGTVRFHGRSAHALVCEGP